MRRYGHEMGADRIPSGKMDHDLDACVMTGQNRSARS